MARKLRIEYPGACYHLINRGNYRDWIFETEGAKKSFLLCLRECCEASGWIVHAWCLMGNHYHLAIETPRGNLVEGMRWLQSTFANRFNRYRKEVGHVFQGRYKAILLDEGRLGAVCHYIHLNPVRAGIVPLAALHDYEWSSFYQLWRPRQRWEFLDVGSALTSAGVSRDTLAGRRSYRAYLDCLQADSTQQRALAFDRMSRGWAQGSKEFRTKLAETHGELEKRVVESEGRELKVVQWEKTTRRALRVLGKNQKSIRNEAKGADWKVALARLLRTRHLTPNGWIADRLSMGQPGTVSQYVNRHKREKEKDPAWLKLVDANMLD